MTTDCLFCKIVSGNIKADKVYEDPDVLAFNDIGPQAPVHVLIIPKRHITSLNDFTDADADLAAKLILAGRKIAVQTGVAEAGYRLVTNCNLAGGQRVWHVHFHLLGGRDMRWPPG